VQKAIARANNAVVLTQPDSVAWVFNLRGFDVPFTPVVPAYAILHAKGKAEIFIAPEKLTEDVKAHLKKIAVTKKPSEIEASLKALGKKKASVLIDGTWTPERIRAVLAKARATVVTGTDPCTLPKARKNRIEQEGARAAQRRDGVAMTRFIRWLEMEAPKGGLTELDVAAKLKAFREQTGELRDLSFETIPAAGPHAAIPHYHADENSNRKLGMDEIFLIDSGGQYVDGTTDITRTVIVGSRRRNEGPLHPRAEGHDQPVAHPLSQGTCGAASTCWPGLHCGGRPRLRPRHRPRRRLLSLGARRPCPVFNKADRTPSTRHDPVQRARLLQAG
jgi:Xaa-Pro aminopeptidase